MLKACFIFPKNADYHTFISFIKSSELNIDVEVSSELSPANALSADMIFVDETVANKECKKISAVKKEKQQFLPVFLVANEKLSSNEALPECIDDIIYKTLLKAEWKRRLKTYINLNNNKNLLFLEEEHKYKALFTESYSIMLLIDPDTGEIVDANHAACKFYGYTCNELVGMNIQQINKLDDGEVFDKIKNILESKTNQFDLHHYLSDGSVKTVEVQSGKIYHKGKNLIYSVINDISDRKKLEDALIKSEQKFNSIFNSAPSPSILVDKDFNLILVNKALLERKGFKLNDVVGKKCYKTFQDRDDICENCAVQRVFEKKQPEATEKTLILPSGQKHFFKTLAYPVFSQNGKVQYVVESTTDITEQKKFENELRESRHLFETLTTITPTGIFRSDANGNMIYANPKWSEISGYSLHEVMGDKWEKILYPEDKELVLKKWKERVSLHQESKANYRIVRPDGSLKWVMGHAVPEFVNGKLKGYVGSIADITDLVLAEQALSKSEQKYKEQTKLFRLMSDNIPDLVWSKDMQGRFVFVNKAVCNRLLIAKDINEPLGKTDMFFAERQRSQHPEDKEWFTFGEICVNSDDVVIKSKKPQRFEEYGNVQGKFLFLDVYKAPIFNEQGEMIGTVGHGRDVTHEKEAEKELLLRDKALSAAANAIVITDPVGRLEWINDAFTNLSGYTREEAIGTLTGDLINSGKQDDLFYEELNNTLKMGKVWKGEFVDKRKDGTLYTVEEIITPVLNEHGKVDHLIGIMTDITMRKENERELKAAKEAAEESSRLKSAFLANMNHEIRTPMNAIMGFSELMLGASPEDKETYAGIINKSSEQLLQLIDDVIFLSRLQSEKLPVKETVFSPAKLVEEVFLMFNLPSVKKNLDLQMLVPGEMEDVSILSDAYKIKQVLTNFVSNAIKYTRSGFVKIGFEKKNNTIQFFVEDSGLGIPENEQENIFDVFYRGEKPISLAIRGTGLGLSIAKGLVELIGGTIGVSSNPEKGSRFYFTIPVKQVNVNNSTKELALDKPKSWNEVNILVAEDDDTSYLYLHELLQNKVRKLDRAVNGLEAVKMVKQTKYDMVFMDIKMPVMNGVDATREIKKEYPNLPVIAATAYASQEEREYVLKAGCDEYLSKPIKMSGILAAIRKYTSKVN